MLNKLDINIESLKNLFQNIENDKEKLKSKIQNIFTKIRTELNSREDELLLEVDKLYNEKYFNDDIIKKGIKLPNKLNHQLKKEN